MLPERCTRAFPDAWFTNTAVRHLGFEAPPAHLDVDRVGRVQVVAEPKHDAASNRLGVRQLPPGFELRDLCAVLCAYVGFDDGHGPQRRVVDDERQQQLRLQHSGWSVAMYYSTDAARRNRCFVELGFSAASLYTVIENAKLYDLAPTAYLYAAIVAADRDELLLPAELAARQSAATA